MDDRKQRSSAENSSITSNSPKSVDEHDEAREIAAREEQDQARRDRIRHFRDIADLPKRYVTADCDALLESGSPQYRTKMQAFLQKVKVSGTYAMLGNRWTGKSNMASAVINAFCDRDRSARYIRAMDFFLEVQRTYRGDGDMSAADVVDSLCDPHLLVIDQLQVRGKTKFEDSLLTHLIDRRYGDMKWTILVSNLRKDEFAAHVGDDISSRLARTGGVLICDWSPFNGSSE